MKHKARVVYYNLERGDKWAKLISWLVYIFAGSRLNHVHIELPEANISYFATLYRGVRVLPIGAVRAKYGDPVFTQTVVIDYNALPDDVEKKWNKETVTHCLFWHLLGRYFNMPVPHTCGKVTADILRDSGYPIPHNIIEPHKILKEVTNANALFIRQGKSWKNNSSQTTS
jgi:hypothetical protein